MDTTETPSEHPVFDDVDEKLRNSKVGVPLSDAEYLAVKKRYPNLPWRDEDQTFVTKKGTRQFARKLSTVTPEGYTIARAKLQESRKNSWDKFLILIAQGHRVSAAAKQAGLSYRTVVNRRRSDPEFKEQLIEAEAQAAEPVEDSLFNAAINGNVPAALEWLKKRSPERWPNEKLQIEQTNVYELDVSDRIGNIVALMSRLQERAELSSGPPVIDVEASEPD